MIPAENLILHRRDRPSRGERENPVRGTITEFIALGETSAVTLRVDASDKTLSLSVPTHVARRNGLAEGGAAAVSLIAESIHLIRRR